ncbi:hypothetical protein GCM10025876_15720 [Demequina litorisediminis]|uniref:Glutamine amidotransferase type-2 domain-containing protein n=1 Tax=Demequina litorisediminis TaxID=1849022 RepID=A0ABQ6IE44_9MICO|nr:hypothetical protein GCM10025876_15720 [Demequina litorisediminis]
MASSVSTLPARRWRRLTYFGLYALQHRGQESAGIATSDGDKILVYKDMGLVSQVFDEAALEALTGHMAVGHARYSTAGASTWANAQPTLGPTKNGTVALGHNGNLTNTHRLLELVEDRLGVERRAEMHAGGSTDTMILTALLGWDRHDTITETALELLPHVEGAFSLVFMDENTLYAARDPQGVRPLVLGKMPSGGWVVASETAALDIVGAVQEREVEPGEFLTINADGVHSQRFADAAPKGCVFEYVYLARPDTKIAGRSVHASRLEMGRQLAREYPVDADMVMPTPESGTPAAVGYAQESGIPFGLGLVKNAYVGRTFIQPSQTLRQARHPPQGSTRCASRSRASASWWWTTRSCAATPNAPWSRCCAKPAPPRSTCGSRRRPSSGRASTASTSRPATNSSPSSTPSTRSVSTWALTPWATSPSRA